MILSGSLIQRKGRGAALVSSRKRLIASWSATREWNTPRLSRRLVSLAKKTSTALSQEAEVGVKWKTKRGCRPSHRMSCTRFPWTAICPTGDRHGEVQHG